MNTSSVILHYEATRQRVHYDTLCEEDDTQLDELDEVASVYGENCSQLTMSTTSKPIEVLQGPGEVNQDETSIPSSSRKEVKGTPEPDETLDTCVVAASLRIMSATRQHCCEVV